MLFSFLEATGIVFKGPIFQRDDGKYPFDIVMRLLSEESQTDSAAHSCIFDFGNPDSPFIDKNYPEYKTKVEEISAKFEKQIQDIEKGELKWMVQDALLDHDFMTDCYLKASSTFDYDLMYAWNVATNFRMMFQKDLSIPGKEVLYSFIFFFQYLFFIISVQILLQTMYLNIGLMHMCGLLF